MKINRILSFVLCIILVCTVFTGCKKDEEFTPFEHEEQPPINLQFNLYIITESMTDDAKNAMNTVNAKINQYFQEKYSTQLNIKYYLADEYDQAIDNLIAGKDDTAVSSNNCYFGGSIVLVVGEEMHNKLVAADKLVDLNPFLDTKDFGTLNMQITPSLLEAAKVVKGTGEEASEHLYCIPNDHVIGEYQYTIVNRAIAEGILNFSVQTELNEMLIVDGAPNKMASELIESVNNNFDLLNISSTDEVIRVVSGNYEDREKWISDGYVCNVTSYPTATKEEAYKAGFGIIKSTGVFNNEGSTVISAEECEKRAMEVVYSINASAKVRNLLQYGVEHTHYTLSEGNVVVPTETNAYKMNLLYTGDAFNALFSAQWTKDMAENGEKQNSQSVVDKK